MIPERKVESASLRAFRDWLVEQARNYIANHSESVRN